MTVESWNQSQYQQAIKAALEGEEHGFEEVDAELSKLPELLRLDFDPAWEVGKPAPGSTDLFVYAIFMGDMAGDRSIYVYPAAGEPAQKLWRRYTLSRVGAAPELEGMARETFIAELGEEYAALIDPEVCPKCGQEVEADPDGAETP